MTGFAIILLATAAIGSIALGSWWFSADQRARRAMRAAPLKRLMEVVDGEMVRVIGQVEVGQTIPAPLSGRACAYWRVVVSEQRGAGKSRRWVTIVDEHEGVDFFLREGDAKALVKVDSVRPVLDKDAKFSSGFMNDATPELQAFLGERGHDTQGWVFNKSIRYHEGVVEAGERVCVVGVGRWERDPDEEARAAKGYREVELPKRLVMESPDDGPLLLSDEPNLTR